jgi:hypothetical protein
MYRFMFYRLSAKGKRVGALDAEQAKATHFHPPKFSRHLAVEGDHYLIDP